MGNIRKSEVLYKQVSSQQGGISIFLVILLPVIIMGCVFAYSLLEQLENENEMQRLAYASSEAYLSRYNEYLFSQFGILANSDVLSLENVISTYAIKNKLIDDKNNISIENIRINLTDPKAFLGALNNAAAVVVGQNILQSGFEIFEQNKHLSDINAKFQVFEQSEKKIEKYFEKSELDQLLLALKQSSNIADLTNYETQIEQYLNRQNNGFVSEITMLKARLNQFDKELNQENLEVISINEVFIRQKEEAYKALEETFRQEQKSIKVVLNLSAQIRVQIESLENQLNALDYKLGTAVNNINILMELNDPSDIEKLELNKLIAMRNEMIEDRKLYQQSIQNLYTDFKEQIKVGVKETSKALYLKILDALYTIEQKFSGTESGNKTILIPEEYDHCAETFTFENEHFNQKVMISEYLMTVFQSYDQNCPRKIEYRDRLKNERQIKGEIEYILTGEVKEAKSLSQVKLKIIALRMPSNLMSLLQSTDKLKELGQITVVLPQPWRTLAFSAGILLWTTAESYVDTNNLLKGKGVSLFKKTNEWQVDLDGLLNSGGNYDFDSKENDIEASIFSADLYYQDYLRILLYTQALDKTVKRTMNLFESELIKNSDQQYSLDKFSNGHTLKIKWRDPGVLLNKMHILEFSNGTSP